MDNNYIQSIERSLKLLEDMVSLLDARIVILEDLCQSLVVATETA